MTVAPSKIPSMTAAVRRYVVATRFALVEQVRNTFALTLILLFIPAWVAIIHWVIPSKDVRFKYRAEDTMLAVSGQDLSLLTGALNAVTLIVGFMLFTATRRSIPFERRLIFAGYSKSPLIYSKITILLVVATATACYATLVARLFWDMNHVVAVGVSLLTAALAYGGIGVLAAVVLPGDLEGMFVIIMVSLVDTIIQNPIGNPVADSEVVRYFPTYGPMQLGVGAAFTDDVPWRYGGIALLWLAATILVGLTVQHLATRARSKHVHRVAPTT